MGLKIKVKAGRINNLSDARYCAGMGVEMLGFLIDNESEESISPELFNAITGWVSVPEIVGELISSSIPDLESYKVSYLEVSDPGLLSVIQEKGLKAILRLDLSKVNKDEVVKLMEEFKNEADYFLLNKSVPDKPTESELIEISEWAKKYPLMLGFGIVAENIESLLNHGIDAIAIYGSSEIRPGFKSYDEIADILEALED